MSDDKPFVPIDEIYRLGGEIVELIMHLARAKQLPPHNSNCGPAYVAGLSMIRMMRQAIEEHSDFESVPMFFEMAQTIPLKTSLLFEHRTGPADVGNDELEAFSEALKQPVFLRVFEKIGRYYDDMQVNYAIIYAAMVCLTTELSEKEARAEICEELRRQLPSVH